MIHMDYTVGVCLIKILKKHIHLIILVTLMHLSSEPPPSGNMGHMRGVGGVSLSYFTPWEGPLVEFSKEQRLIYQYALFLCINLLYLVPVRRDKLMTPMFS